MSLEVEARGLEQLGKFLEATSRSVDNGVGESLDLLGEMALQKAKDYAPVRTGRLRESIYLDIVAETPTTLALILLSSLSTKGANTDDIAYSKVASLSKTIGEESIATGQRIATLIASLTRAAVVELESLIPNIIRIRLNV